MKNLFVLVLALTSAGILNNVAAQCTPPAPTANPGLSPDWECLPCVERTVAYAQVITIENFDEVSGVVVNSLRIDSLTNIPAGLSYTVNPPNATFPGGGTGCIDVTGTTTEPAGNYKLGIYVTVNIQGIGDVDGEAGEIVDNLILLGFIDTTSGTVPNFDYFVRVIEAGTVCDSSACIALGTNDLNSLFSGLSAQPNPMTTQTQISWNSNTDGKFTAKMFDVAGKEVFTQQLHVRIGTNNVTVERENLPAGSYVFVITDGRKSISTKVMVRE